MSLTPEQLKASTEYLRVLDGIARRLILEGKAHVEKGKLIIHKKQERKRRNRSGVQYDHGF